MPLSRVASAPARAIPPLAVYGKLPQVKQIALSPSGDGVADLARRGWFDPSRACIVGAIYGGDAAMAGVTLQQGLYRCAVSIGGVADLQLILRQARSDGGRREQRYWERFIGAKSGADLLEALSPADQAARADKPVTLLELEGEDHLLSIETTRLATLEAMMAFVLKHNPPVQR